MKITLATALLIGQSSNINTNNLKPYDSLDHSKLPQYIETATLRTTPTPDNLTLDYLKDYQVKKPTPIDFQAWEQKNNKSIRSSVEYFLSQTTPEFRKKFKFEIYEIQGQQISMLEPFVEKLSTQSTDPQAKIIFAQDETMSKSHLRMKLDEFLNDECTRCQDNPQLNMDPHVNWHFAQKFNQNHPVSFLSRQYYGYDNSCQVCRRNDKDLEALLQFYFQIIKQTPMMMNSVNLDSDYQENTEQNKFAFVDRSMINSQGWQETLSHVNNQSRQQLNWNQKIDKAYWRGDSSGFNQTIFGPDQSKMNCELVADLLQENPDETHQSAWPRMHFLLNARNEQDFVDAKLTSWNPTNRRCWTPDFSQNYQDIFASDVKLFTTLNQLESQENESFINQKGQIISLLKDIVRQDISSFDQDKFTNLYNQIIQSSFKQELFQIFISGMNGFNKVQDISADEISSFIDEFRLSDMTKIFKNENVLYMLKKYIDVSYPEDMFGQDTPIEEQLSYKYIVSIDGDTAEQKRPQWALASDSVLFKTTSKYFEWYYDGLVPWVNYIPLRPDMSDLIEKVKWARSHDRQVQQISKNGQKLAETIFNEKAIQDFEKQTFENYYTIFKNTNETKWYSIEQTMNENKDLSKKEKYQVLFILEIFIAFIFTLVAISIQTLRVEKSNRQPVAGYLRGESGQTQ